MPAQKNYNGRTCLIEKFNLPQKLYIRTGFYGFMAVGTWGIYSQSIIYGLLYTGFVIAGLKFGLLNFICAHCPYPYKYSDCLFAPYRLITQQYEFRPDAMGASDKIGFVAIMAGFIIIPQYWLIRNHTLLVLFWVLCLPTLAGFPFHLCKRCRHFDCPLNSANKKLIKKQE